MNNQTYQEALNYIYRHVENSHIRHLKYNPNRLTTRYIQALLEHLDNPHLNYPVIHIAGTKGKSSTAAMLSSALQANGYKVGLFTSPYMLDFREQIQLNGLPIRVEQFVDAIDLIRPRAERLPQISAFELTTAAAFLSFSRQQTDIAVVETGVGGRTDATNVVRPLISIITSISYDHANFLGSTLTEIATHKAGIIKPGRPVVSAVQPAEARDVIREAAVARQSRLIEINRDYCYLPQNHSLDGQTLNIWSCSYPERPLELQISLLGAHQLENAAIAFATLDTIRQENFQISDNAIFLGFKSTIWPGRFEVLRRNPPVVVDCAHNPDSVKKLIRTIEDYFPNRIIRLVFGSSEDKSVENMLAQLRPLCMDIFTSQSSHPRAMPESELAEISRRLGYPTTQTSSVAEAFDLALRQANPKTDLVLVTGSIFVAAEARDAWQKTHTETV